MLDGNGLPEIGKPIIVTWCFVSDIMSDPSYNPWVRQARDYFVSGSSPNIRQHCPLGEWLHWHYIGEESKMEIEIC